MKNTALTETHEALGAKMVPFAGYNMPVSYEGINSEHETVRNGVGVFDVSHMGEFLIEGPNALNLIQKVTESLDVYSFAKASESIENFFIEDLSLWYIRRSRRRLQRPENEQEKKEIVSTFYYVLLNLSKLIAPIMPFLAEEIYQGLRIKGMPESIHLYDWKEVDKGKINLDLGEKMREVREIVNQALAKRAEEGIKVRQPLSDLQIVSDKLSKEEELLEIIKKEVNVKSISFGKEVKLNTEITPELKKEGEIRDFIRTVQRMRKKSGLTPEDIVSIQFIGGSYSSELLLNNKEEITETTKGRDLERVEKSEDFLIEKEIQVGEDTVQVFLKK